MEEQKNKAKRVADRIIKFMANVVKTGKDKRNEAFLNARMQLLENYWKEYVQQHDALIEVTPTDNMKADAYFEEDMFSQVECAYIAAVASLQEELDAFYCKPDDSCNRTDAHSSHTSFSAIRAIKLPKINIPSFTGSYFEWPSFRDTYTSLIHENPSLSDIQKLHYLKSTVSGDAAVLLQHLAVTSDNYKAAWGMLMSRFENTRLLVNVNIQKVVSLPNMATESAKELRRVLDSFTQAVRALENLKRPVNEWDDWLVYFLANKLDSSTRKDWETSLKTSTSIPSFQKLQTFLEGRIHTLSALKDTHRSEVKIPTPRRVIKPGAHVHHTAITKNCHCCQGKHLIMFCPQFRSKSVTERNHVVQHKQLCGNCLRPNHDVAACPSQHRCKQCYQKHHTMLHNHQTSSKPVPSTQQVATESALQTDLSSRTDVPTITAAYLANNTVARKVTLLATAVVSVTSATGKSITARALLDQGSESSFITTSLAKSLQLTKKRVNVSVMGVGQCFAGTIKASVSCTITSKIDSQHSYIVRAFILPTLTQFIPSQPIAGPYWAHIEDLTLADDDFNKPAQIDLILGADIYAQVLKNEVRHGPEGSPIAQNTTLGWVLSGAVKQKEYATQSTVSMHTTLNDVETVLRKFWEVEEPPKASILTPDEEECENLYKTQHHRTSIGRYVVKLPFKGSTSQLGESRSSALDALTRMERRFERDTELHTQYSAFMQEYLSLNHMEQVEENVNNQQLYYLPHHAVLKPTSTTTKLRVVFNASQKTSTGYTLNDILHTGPKVQNDVHLVLLKWRFFPLVFTADIEKMYRQILVDAADVDYQRILWRRTTSEPIKAYRLLTVTYGTACAPYLACRTLHQLAEDYQTVYPLASSILRHNFYVDDALFGAYDTQSAIKIRDELCKLLQHGNFKLRKWLSNSSDLLSDIPMEDRENPKADKLVADMLIKTLGIRWNPDSDMFHFQIELPHALGNTKRSLLSDVSRLYDPLGWLSPITIVAKMFIQKLWMLKVDWDDLLPSELSSSWQTYRDDLTNLCQLSINRWIGTTNSHLGIELHGFCDASLSAYAAAIYVRVIHDFDNIQTTLLMAKAKVSPLKTISLPRLELCGAALLAELIAYTQQNLELNNISIHTWTDSTIVLSWLREHPSKWKTFVSNRVALIHDRIPGAVWHHIKSEHNPVDCATRGLSVAELHQHDLWWQGPRWLRQPSSQWPKADVSPASNLALEEVRIAHTCATKPRNPDFELLHRYSSLTKLVRVTAYCRRFVFNSRAQVTQNFSGTLSVHELNLAMVALLKAVQSTQFAAELRKLQKNEPIPTSSKLITLNPVLNEMGLLCVGGRLKHADLSNREKQPIILPNTNVLTDLIVKQAHAATLHGGTQLTLHHLRNKYWILRGRSKIKQVIHKCITCFRNRPKMSSQLMADLPPERVRPSKPFLNSGVDYAGPFNVVPIKRRGQKSYKCYVAVFVCLVTRAIHLELVHDLSSEAFIAAFKRFISRRGRCQKLWSDNATNFVGASRLLAKHFHQLLKDEAVSNFIATSGTEWKFIPPASPHFGGIWEAGVKSFKHHFRRVVNETVLSVEEMLTVIAQIEGCLNSRPMHAMSDDPDDFLVITPGHFLIGESTISVPYPEDCSTSVSRMSRWELVQHMVHDLWKRWYKDYIHHLQTRSKWHHQEANVKVNDLVLIQDDNLPPTKWLLGRIVQTHPGADGNIRVVSIKHKGGIFKRAVTKLCPLPLESQN